MVLVKNYNKKKNKKKLTILTLSPFTSKHCLITSFKTGHPGERK